MNPIEPILQAYTEGHPALLLSGRSLYDFVTDDSRLRPLLEFLRRTLFREYGMVFITYSLANGLQWFESWITDEADRCTVREVLRNSHLLEIAPSANEMVAVVRGIAALSRANTENLKWKDGRAMRFAVCLEFSEHLAPSLINGTQTDAQMIVSELVHLTSQSLALRDSGNLILFHGCESSLIDELACGALHHIHLPQPDKEEKKEFLKTALELYSEASFETGLKPEGVVALTINTPNRGIENLLRASHRGKRVLTAKEISEQKNRDVEQLSEGTLRVLDTYRVKKLQLVGRNIEKPQAVLLKLADCLLRGDTSMPGQVLLAGAPGTAKTDLSLLVSDRSMSPAYEMLSPKGSLVGETERKARLQQQALKEWTPNVAFCDEISEAFPLQRNDEFDGDSGASRAVTATLLTALSDETRRGKSLLIATTNRPWAMGAAMRSRFIVIPVLFPLKEDFPSIIVATAERIAPTSQLNVNDAEITQAADIFYQKGANPRHLRSALSNALLLSGKSAFEPADILFAAHDLCATTDFASTVYADLWAIKGCSSRSFLPWSNAPDKYNFPDYLKGIVNETTGEINETELNKRIAELKPNANV